MNKKRNIKNIILTIFAIIIGIWLLIIFIQNEVFTSTFEAFYNVSGDRFSSILITGTILFGIIISVVLGILGKK